MVFANHRTFQTSWRWGHLIIPCRILSEPTPFIPWQLQADSAGSPSAEILSSRAVFAASPSFPHCWRLIQICTTLKAMQLSDLPLAYPISPAWLMNSISTKNHFCRKINGKGLKDAINKALTEQWLTYNLMIPSERKQRVSSVGLVLKLCSMSWNSQ